LFRFIVGFIKSIEHTQMFVEFKKGENLAAAGDGVVFAADVRGNVFVEPLEAIAPSASRSQD